MKAATDFAAVSVDQALVRIGSHAGLGEQRGGARREADELAVGEGIGDEIPRGRLRQPVARRLPRTSSSATASNSTDGPPSIFCLAAIAAAVGGLDAADLRRDDLHRPRLPSRAPPAAPSAASASAPSLTSTPSLRPSKLSGPFLTMLSAGDGCEIVARRRRRRRPASAAASCRACRRPSSARPSSMLSRCETMRSRIAGVSTLRQLEDQRIGDVLLLDRRSG